MHLPSEKCLYLGESMALCLSYMLDRIVFGHGQYGTLERGSGWRTRMVGVLHLVFGAAGWFFMESIM
jgi:hypothetical protein